MTSRTGSTWRILGDLKKSVSWVESCRPKKKGNFHLLAEALGRCRMRWGGCGWKSQNRKNVYLPPYVEGPLNSKVIKSFVPELRSCKCFSCFEIPMFYVYMLWTFYVHFAYPYHGYGTLISVQNWYNIPSMHCYNCLRKTYSRCHDGGREQNLSGSIISWSNGFKFCLCSMAATATLPLYQIHHT